MVEFINLADNFVFFESDKLRGNLLIDLSAKRFRKIGSSVVELLRLCNGRKTRKEVEEWLGSNTRVLEKLLDEGIIILQREKKELDIKKIL